MSKNFHYDYYSLRNIDIEQWNENFFWPIARETTTQITIDFHAELKRLVNELGDCLAGDCLLIGWQFTNNYIRAINHYVAIQRLKAKGYDIVFSDQLTLIPLLLSNDEYRFDQENIRFFAREGYWKNIFTNLLKSLYVNLSSNRFRILDHFRDDECIYAFPNENIRNRIYTKKIDQWIRITTSEEWLNDGIMGEISQSIQDELKVIAKQYLFFAKNYCLQHFDISLPENLCNALLSYTDNFLVNIGEVYNALLKKTAKKCPKHLLTPTAGKTFIRALSLAIRRQGGRVTGFPHGYFICHNSSPRLAIHELSTVDDFMAYTPGSVELINRNLRINPPARNNPIKVLHENNPIFMNRWHKYEDRPLSKKIETVMILELSLIVEWAGYYAVDSMVNYQFYYNLCKFLTENGYKVIFKKRPKSLKWDGVNLFEKMDNITITDVLFETPGLMDQADAIFCQYAMSSTLYWSMCTNKTVIYIDAGWESWFSDVYELMAKRCRILHCWYDGKNRQCFNKKELLEILRKPPSKPNAEFLEKYLFPC